VYPTGVETNSKLILNGVMCVGSHQYRPLLVALEKRIAYSLVQ